MRPRMNHVLDIDQLRTFLAIAELGSFTKAGEAVHKTQSAVSMQMRRLEERVGQPIFIKDGRQSRLTENGLKLRWKAIARKEGGRNSSIPTLTKQLQSWCGSNF